MPVVPGLLNRSRRLFAAKEAVVKAMGDVGELRPLDVEVVTASTGRPGVV